MKYRLTLIFAALVVLLGAMIWVVQDRTTASVAPGLFAERTVAIRVAVLREQAVSPANISASSVVASEPQIQSSPMVHVDPAGQMRYVAREGDTVSQLAIALLGTDTK